MISVQVPRVKDDLKTLFRMIAVAGGVVILLHGQAHVPSPSNSGASYMLGPGDQITIRAAGVDEFDGKPEEVDLQGYVDVPIVGHVMAAGLTPQQLENSITVQLKQYVLTPAVTVTVTEFKSKPVSVVGAVNEPGVYRLNGENTLVQVLSQAKGLAADAGDSINITRQTRWGPLPLPDCTKDATGGFYTAKIDTKRLFEARDPSANIKIKPDDVVSIPKAEMIYVVGAVNKAGAFVLSQRNSISVLQAISMAEGLDKTAAGGRAKIIHRGDNNQRVERSADLTKIFDGRAPDMPLVANDILFVPNSVPKSASLRALEAAIQLGTGVVIYRR